MIETLELHKREIDDTPGFVRPRHVFERGRLPGQVLRFGLAGGLNTLVDLLILNGLLWLFPTTSSPRLLAYNSLAYSLGAVNSFLLNKYWTFGQKQRTTRREVARFTLTTLCGIGWSTIILLLASNVSHPFLVNATVWANASKVVAIAGTALISYLGMRLWVFASKRTNKQALLLAAVPAPDTHVQSQLEHVPTRGDASIPTPASPAAPSPLRGEGWGKHGPGDHYKGRPTRLSERFAHRYENARRLSPMSTSRDTTGEREQHRANENEDKAASRHSLSVVLPAYNEEQVIAGTVSDVLDVLSAWRIDAEVLVVNDGSADKTGAIVAALALAHPQIRLITHSVNQGYGAALVSGFAAATKDLTLFMDADGQFDMRDLARLLPFIDEYDAVIGYRLQRQDSWMRKLNAWGWKRLIGWVLGIHVRDIDCAFKLLRTGFLHQYPLETRGAMINAELLYKLKRAGYTYKEVGVHHLPRQGGRATGANPRVIARAFRELFISAHKWRREERGHARQYLASENHPF